MSTFSYYSEEEYQEVISVLLGNAGPAGLVFVSLHHELGSPYSECEYYLTKISVVMIRRNSGGFCFDSTAPLFRRALEAARRIVQATPSFSCAQFARRPLGRWKSVKLNRLAYSVFAGFFDDIPDCNRFRPMDLESMAEDGLRGYIGALQAGIVSSNIRPFAEIAAMNYRSFIESEVDFFKLGFGFDTAVIYGLGWFATAHWGLFKEMRMIASVVIPAHVREDLVDVRRPSELCGHFRVHDQCVPDQFTTLDEEWEYTEEQTQRVETRLREVPSNLSFDSLSLSTASEEYSAELGERMTQ